MFLRGKFHQAIAFWLNQLRNGCPPYIITPSILVELLWKHCHELEIKGCYVDVVLYNSLISSACTVLPNAITFNTLLHFICILGRWQEAEELFPIMDQTSNTPTMSAAISVLKTIWVPRRFQQLWSGLLDRAIDFLAQMVYQGRSPDVIMYNTFLGGVMDDAFDVLYVLKSKDVSLVQVIYNIVIDGLVKEGGMGKALGIAFSECPMIKAKIEPDEITYTLLIGRLCRTNMVEEVVNMLMEMVMKKFRPRIGTYNTMIKGLCIGNKVDAAIDILDMMVSRWCRPNEDRRAWIFYPFTFRERTKDAIELHKRFIERKVLKKDVREN
ncbi:hypothetical protein AMTRI_Chr07g26920 [Amborella trichopoda]